MRQSGGRTAHGAARSPGPPVAAQLRTALRFAEPKLAYGFPHQSGIEILRSAELTQPPVTAHSLRWPTSLDVFNMNDRLHTPVSPTEEPRSRPSNDNL